ncbi:MAG: c-type cytochrome [Pseudomonadota bacterium]
MAVTLAPASVWAASAASGTSAAPSSSPHSQPHPASRAGPGANSRRVIPVNASLGERIYINNCAVCHGDKGAGAMWTQATFNPPPRKFASLQSREELTRERMINSVTYGRPDTAMMPFGSRLSDTEIAAVVDHIRATFMSDKAIAEAAAAASAGNSGAMPPHGHGAAGEKAEIPKPKPAPIVDADMSLPFPGNLAGDGAKGRDFYMANCFTCHGKAGDGEGPRSTFIRPKPRNFLHPDSRRTLNRPALFKAISNGKIGTVMPAWGKVLNDQEIADVAEFVFQEFIRPSPQKKKVSGN